MKTLLALCLFVFTSLVWAGENSAALPPPVISVKGEVLEVKDVESYTYLRLKTRDGEIWAAVSKAKVKKGEKVTVENVMVMSNFESKSLKKTFPKILFGNLAGAASPDMATAHAVRTVEVGNIHVAKAVGENARTVAEVITKGLELKDKPILLRGKIVKYNPGIMGRNWLHLRDGTGSDADGTNDVLVTTANQAKLGDVVTVKGIVRNDKDFGAGYAYKVMIEDATLQP